MEFIRSIIDFILHIDHHLVEIVNDYKTWTYLVLFVIIFAETGLVVTPFLPGDSLLFAAGQRSREQNANNAIVMVSSSYVKSAPDAGSGDLFMVHEGTRLQILDQVGEWNKIRLADGKVGWMEKQSFERI